MADAARRRRAQRPRASLAAALCSFALLLAGCTEEPAPEATAQAEVEATPEGVTPTSEVPYQLTIEGVEDATLRDLLNEVSETRRLIDRPPPSLARLRRRAEDDRARLDEALRSQGYYNAKIDLSIDAAAKPVKVVFKVDPGPRYRLREVAIEVTPPGCRPAAAQRGGAGHRAGHAGGGADHPGRRDQARGAGQSPRLRARRSRASGARWSTTTPMPWTSRSG